jgi:hypothetical protein
VLPPADIPCDRAALDALDQTVMAAFCPTQPYPTDRLPNDPSQPALALAGRILWLAAALVEGLGLPVFEVGRIIAATPEPPGTRVRALVPLLDGIPEQITQQAFAHARDTLLQLLAAPGDLDRARQLRTWVDESLFRRFDQRPVVNVTTLGVLRAAFERGIPVRHIDQHMYQLGWGCRARWTSRSAIDTDAAFGMLVSHDKQSTASVLRQAGLPAAEHVLAHSPDAAVAGFSIDASVRIALIDRDVPSYFRSLEHLLRYCARPPFALERLSVIRDASGRITRVRYSLPRHKAANWVGPGRGRTSTRPGANGVVELSPFEFLDRLADLVPPPRKHRHRYHGVFAPNHRLRKAVTLLAIGNIGKRRDAATGGQAACGAVGGHAVEGCCDTHAKPRSHDTSRIAWAKLMARVGEEFPLECPACGGDIRLIAFITEPGPIRKILTHLGEPLQPPLVSTARGPPTDWGELVQVHDERDIFQASPQELPAIDIHSH